MLEKREVQDEDNLEGEVESDDLGEDEDGVVEESGLDVEEPFDPIINKGFCKLTFSPKRVCDFLQCYKKKVGTYFSS